MPTLPPTLLSIGREREKFFQNYRTGRGSFSIVHNSKNLGKKIFFFHLLYGFVIADLL
jgi:hypothetical protein